MVAVLTGLVMFAIGLNFFIQRRIKVIELQRNKSGEKVKQESSQEIITPSVVKEVDTLRNRKEITPVYAEELVQVPVVESVQQTILPVAIVESVPQPVVVQEVQPVVVQEVQPIIVQEVVQEVQPVVVQEVQQVYQPQDLDLFQGVPEKVVTTFPLMPTEQIITQASPIVYQEQLPVVQETYEQSVPAQLYTEQQTVETTPVYNDVIREQYFVEPQIIRETQSSPIAQEQLYQSSAYETLPRQDVSTTYVNQASVV